MGYMSSSGKAKRRSRSLCATLTVGCTITRGSQVSSSRDAVAPLMRSNSVLMQRVRHEQYARLDAMQQGGLLKGAMFIHLKQDLDVVAIDWFGCEQPPETLNRQSESLTEYGVRKEVQELLARIRTELDSFSDIEAFALMTSGYRMVEHYLPKIEVLPTTRPERRRLEIPCYRARHATHIRRNPATNVSRGCCGVPAAGCFELGRSPVSCCSRRCSSVSLGPR